MRKPRFSQKFECSVGDRTATLRLQGLLRVLLQLPENPSLGDRKLLHSLGGGFGILCSPFGQELADSRRDVVPMTRPSTHLFMSECKAPISVGGFQKIVERLNVRAKLGFQVHAHMLRHACGFKMANDGVDTRTIQAYLGHKDIRHTVRYTELSPVRFKGLWRD